MDQETVIPENGHAINGEKIRFMTKEPSNGEPVSEKVDVIEDLSHFQRLYSTYPEYKDPVEGKLIGACPDFLNGGTLICNGPGLFHPGPPGVAYRHLLDPLSLIQRFYFDEDKVFFTSEYLPTKSLNLTKGGVKVAEEFGTKAFSCKGKTWRWKQTSDNAPNNLTRIGNSLFCVSSHSLQAHQVNWDTRSIAASPETKDWKKLELRIQVREDSLLENGSKRRSTDSTPDNRQIHDVCLSIKLKHLSPNPHYDRTKEIVTNIGTTKDSYCVFKIYGKEKNLKMSVIARIPFTDAPCLIQSFGVSRRFYVFFETPDRLNMKKYALRKPFGFTLRDCIEWKKTAKTKICVIDKRQKTCIQFEAEHLFISKHINCYEESGSLIVDVVAHKDHSRLKSLMTENLRQGQFPSSETQLLRFILPLELNLTASVGENLVRHTGIESEATCVLGRDSVLRVTPHHLIEQEIDFPVINYSGFNAKKYRFLYALDVPHDGSALWGTKIFKIDVEDGCRWEWRREADHFFLNPPIFVPNPEQEEEDEGVVLVPVTSTDSEADSFLLLLDASSFEEIGRTMFQPRLPISFASAFIHRIPLEMEEPPVVDKLI